MCLLLPLSLASCKGKTEQDKADGQQGAVFPMKLDGGKIIIEKIEGVDGLFVEKGGNDEVKGVAAVIVKNASDKMLEYANISFKVNQYEGADFVVSALPAGESAIVMESFARSFSSDDVYEPNAQESAFTYCDASPKADGIEIKTDGADITVKNNTDKELSPCIVYKYYRDGMYYGGIAFRGTFENIAAGGSVTRTSDRFTDDCKIVNIII